MDYKIYKVGDDELKVKLNEIDQFLKMNPSAVEVDTDTPGKPQGTSQSQNNQHLQLWDGEVDLKTGNLIGDTESNLEAGSLDSKESDKKESSPSLDRETMDLLFGRSYAPDYKPPSLDGKTSSEKSVNSIVEDLNSNDVLNMSNQLTNFNPPDISAVRDRIIPVDDVELRRQAEKEKGRLQHETLLKYDRLLDKYKTEDQSESDFAESLDLTTESVYHSSIFGGAMVPVEFIGGVTNSSVIGEDDPRFQPEKFHELKFLHSQLNSADIIKSRQFSNWHEGLDAAEIVVWNNNRAKLVDPNIHTNFQKFADESVDEQSFRLEDFDPEYLIEVEDKMPTISENHHFLNKLWDEDFKDFEQDFATTSSAFYAAYEKGDKELVEKYGPSIQEQAIGEFQGDIDQITPYYQQELQQLYNKYEKEVVDRFPDGTSPDNPELDKYEKQFLIEQKGLYNKHFSNIEEAINERYNQLLSEVPEIITFEADQRKKYEALYNAEWDRYIDAKSGLYNKWSKETLDEIAHNFDANNTGDIPWNSEQQKMFLSKELARRLEIMDKSETPFFANDGERDEYISDYWHYFMPKMQWTQTSDDADPQATHFYLKGMGKELNDWAGGKSKPYDVFSKSRKSEHSELRFMADGNDNAYNYNIKNYDGNGNIINKDNIKDGDTTGEILSILFEDGIEMGLSGQELHNYVGQKYKNEAWPYIEQTLRFSEDIIANPENINDLRNGEFLSGFTSHRLYQYIPVVGGLADMNDSVNIKRIYDKARDCGREDCLEGYERKLLAAANLMQQSDHLTSKISRWYNGGQMAGHSLPFVAEFMIGNVGFRAASQATKTAMKTGLAARLNRLNNITGRGGARYSKGKDAILFSRAKDGRKIWMSEKGVDGLAMLLGLTSQTAMQPWRINKTAAELLTGEYAYAFSNLGDETIADITAVTAFDEDGKKMKLKDTDKSFEEAWLRAFGNTFAEVFTERLGYYLPGIPRRFLNKGRVKGTPIGDMLFDSDMYQKISMGFVMRKLGMKSGEELVEWAAKNGGWNGVLGEYAEEIINIPLQNIAMGDNKPFQGIFKYDRSGKNIGFDWENLHTTGISVAGMGGVFTGIGMANNAYHGGDRSFVGWIGNNRYNTQEAFTKRLNRLKKEGRLNKDLNIEIKNDYDLIDKTWKFLEKNGLKKEQLKVPSPKSKHKITASELDIMNHEDLTDENAEKLADINNQLGELNRQTPSKENKKKKDELNAKRQEIIEPIVNDIIAKKTTKLYQETIAKVKELIKQAKAEGKVRIVETKNGEEAEAALLDFIGLKRIKKGKRKGVIVNRNGKEITEITDNEGNSMLVEDFVNGVKTSHGFYIPKIYVPKGQATQLILNEERSVTTGAPNVAAHEFLHFYLDHVLQQSPELKVALGEIFQRHLRNIDPKMVRDGEFRKRLNSYWDQDLATQSEEALTVFLDALATGSMDYNDGMMARIGTSIRHLLYNLGWNIKLDDGKDVYNFLKDFNTSVQRGEFSTGLLNALENKIKVGGVIRQLAESEQMQKVLVKDEERMKQIEKIKNLEKQIKEVFSRAGIKHSLPEEEDLEEDIKLTKSTAAVVRKNEEILNKIKEIAEKKGISLKEAVTDRIKGELIINNMGLAIDLAKQAYESGWKTLRDAGVPNFMSKAIDYLDWEQEFMFELTALANTWDPAGVPFGAYIQSKDPKQPIKKQQGLLARRYNQILNRLKGKNLEAYSLSALEEKGFDQVDTSKKTTGTGGIQRIKISDMLDLDVDNINELIAKSDLSKLKEEPSYKKVKSLVKTGSLKPVLNELAKYFGVPVNKLSGYGDLTNSERESVRKKIAKLAEDNNLIDMLPEAQDEDGRSTEIVRTLFKTFYKPSGKRVKVGEGALKALGQKERWDKRSVVSNNEFFDLFGMDEKGKATKKGTEFDGAMREFIVQLASIVANQQIRSSQEGFEFIGRGMSPLLFSKLEEVDEIGAEVEKKKIRDNFDTEYANLNALLKSLGLPPLPRIRTEDDIQLFIKMIKDSGVFLLGPKAMFFAPNQSKDRDTGEMKYASIFTTSSSNVGITKKSIPDREFRKRLWRKFQDEIQKLYHDKSIKWGDSFENLKDAKGNNIGVKDSDIWSLRNTYSSVFTYTKGKVKIFSPEKARKNKDKIEDFNRKISVIHKEMWRRIKKQVRVHNENTVRGKKKKMNLVGIGLFLALVANDTKHWHKLGAQIIGFSKEINPYMENGKMREGRYEFEHAMPATKAYMYLLVTALNPKFDFEASYDFIIGNYKLIALDKAMDKKLTNAKTETGRSLQKTMPDNWSVIYGKWWERYFNEIVEAIDGGINPESIETIDGSTIGEMFNINSSGGIRASMPASKVKSIQNVDNAFSNKIKHSKSGKTFGTSIFDFDDTLGFTKSGIRVRVPNEDGTPKPKKKVIFLAGGAGSGKGNVVSKLGLEEMGYKIVNQDISLEWLKKNHGLPENMNDLNKEQRSTLGKLGHQARGIARRKMMKFQGRGDGVVVDGTGASLKQMQKLVDEFEAKGYDVSMIFVGTSLDVALARNRARKERSLLDIIVKKNHESVMNNKEAFKEIFGDRFMEVNTDNLTQESPMPNLLVSQVEDFTSSYERLRLDAAEFAERGSEILDRGGEFDFSEFNDVVDGTPGPLLDKAKERAAKYGTKDIYVLTARPQASAEAIHQFLKSQGLDIPLKNIVGLGNSTGQAKADWILEKYAEGYNDIYFVDDAYQNVEAVQNVLDQLDVKSDVVQAGIKFSRDGSTELNKMIERKKGVKAEKIFSEAEAKRRGSKGKIANLLKNLYIPPSAEDFKGLLYYFIGKGKQGEADLQFFADHLLKPFAKGIRAWNTYKQNMVDDYKTLKEQFPGIIKTLNNKIPGTSFTVDTAVRVWLWNEAGFKIPGISKQLQNKLVSHVNNNPDLISFANGLSLITKRKEGYVEPSENWPMESISTDLRNTVDKMGRKDFLEEWINNKDIIFTPENLNKIEAVYGTDFRDALENILFRMETGTNRIYGKDKMVNWFTEWINGSIGAIMFFNMRSALLQTISTINFINWHDNNIFKASAAFANQPQFWKDFVMLFNSDQLKQRRKGLQTDVSASELTKTFAENGYSPQTVINWLLQKGFTPTQIADSFAIAFGGASLFRNRYNRYVKEGMTPTQAQEQAMLDFQEIAEETQQSSREDLISQQQASVLGRFILAFQNVTMQYGRLTKKALSDLVNGRGDWKTNVSKIMYYGVAQNVLFGALQSALAFIMWGDDEEEIKKKETRVANQALDSFLKGTGIYGALAATLKNIAIQWHLQKDKPYGQQSEWPIVKAALDLSPPIGSKVRHIVSAFRTMNWNEGVSEELGWRIENPKLQAAASLIEGVFNIPLARVRNKANNLEEAITGNHDTWKKVLMGLGWSGWELNVKDEELEAAKTTAKEKRAEQKRVEKEKKKKEKLEEERKEKRRKGIKTVRCSGTNSSGKRCSLTTETNKKSWKCFHHAEFKDGMDRDKDGKKEYRCKAIKGNGQRCNNKTENKNKRCYAHQ